MITAEQFYQLKKGMKIISIQTSETYEIQHAPKLMLLGRDNNSRKTVIVAINIFHNEKPGLVLDYSQMRFFNKV